MSDQNVFYVDTDTSPVLQDFPADQREALQTLNDIVAAGTDLTAVLNRLFDHTHTVFPCDRIGVAFVEEDATRVVARWARADYKPIRLKVGYAQNLAGSSLEEILRTRRVRVINDLERYLADHPQSESTRLIVEEGVRSSMTCPLIVEDRVVGLLFRSSRRPHAYSRREVLSHLAVAQRLAQAVEKTWRIDQLQRAQSSYMEMLAFVSHELKNPLAGVVMEAELLREGYFGPLEPKVDDRIRRISGRAESLLALISEYLDLARIEGRELRPDVQPAVDLVSEILRPTLEMHEEAARQKHITLVHNWPDEFRVPCDPNLIKIVVSNLVGNAIKYGRENGRVEIEAAQKAVPPTMSDEDSSTGAASEELVLTVWNEGPGFPPEQKGKLFHRFSRVETPELLKQKGTGIGLYTSRRIIRAHNGRIWAQSEPGHWARFGFSLPLASSTAPPQ